MGQVKTEKTFYRNFFSIYIVLVLQNVVTISVNLADNVMLGGYSETALSGVAAVNQIQFVYQQLLTALGDGLVIFCSQYWGKRQTQPMRRISAAAMQAGLLIAVLLFAAVSLFPEQAVGLFTTETAIIREGASYLRIVRFTYFFFAVTTILLATLRSVEESAGSRQTRMADTVMYGCPSWASSSCWSLKNESWSPKRKPLLFCTTACANSVTVVASPMVSVPSAMSVAGVAPFTWMDGSEPCEMT